MIGDALQGMRVLELGNRLAVGACGRLLADLGAEVIVAEPRVRRHDHKWIDRALATARRRSVLVETANDDDMALLARMARGAHAVLISSDLEQWPEPLASALKDASIVCDITAFGATGPLSGVAADEVTLQAMTGIMATTGFADGAPVPVAVPIVELSSGIYAATAVTLAWRVLRRDGVGQHIDIALYDTAFNALTTFLPAHFAGKIPGRLGNGHSMAVPWNAYQARDGWILICSANDVHWRKLASLIGVSVAADPRYATLAQRLAQRADVDALVSAWVATLALDALVTVLAEAGIACGPIVPVAELATEPNLVARHTIATVEDPVEGRAVRLPNTLVRCDDAPGAPPAVALPDDGRLDGGQWPPVARRRAGIPHAPFAGLRVLEIGQFTTAPLAARHLASFGADVIKVEPAEGDSARAWAPHRNGTSHFFIMSNGEKRSLALDLRSDAGRAAFTALLEEADVLVENMKPGSLERLGYDAPRLCALNPRLVYCAISGFGAHSAYAGRPAFDTVAQAMCGMMDATRVDGIPMKSGISAADIGGGQVGLLGIAAALERRERTGRGACLDIAMQDVGAWFSQTRWNVTPEDLRCETPVSSVAEACAHPQTRARDLIVQRPDAAGTAWDLLRSPLRLELTPPRVGVPLGAPVAGPMTWRDAPGHLESSGDQA